MRAPSKSKVYFFYERPVTLVNRTSLKKFIESIFKSEGHSLSSLNYIFCSDKRLLQINNEYLGHDFYTDIITFELSDPGEPIQGEIYISIDRVKENAKILNEPIYRELQRVMFHGALHLCGYGDKTKIQQEEMREKEGFYLLNYK